MGHCHCSNSHCSTQNHVEYDEHSYKKYTPAIISFVLLIVGIILNQTQIEWFANKWINLLWFIIAYIPVGFPVLKEGWESILEKEFFNEFTLMGIASIGAFCIGEYPEGVAVMLFYSIGELFQDDAVDKAKRNISALLDVRPESASVVKGDSVQTIPAESVQVGDIVEVKVGDRVPLDGILENKSASFNTSALTGESTPRSIHKGEEVLAGMIVTDNVSRIVVDKPFGQSALSRILDLVQNATEKKAKAEQFIRKFARVYTPIVTLLAVLIVLIPWLYSLLQPSFVFIFSDWLYRGLVFLVISCPCALVVSIPLGFFGGIGAASKHGILFKGSNYLEAITKVNTVVMDKTGTLTEGVFDVQKIVPSEGISEKDLLAIVASLEKQSNHPIAKAIVRYANQEQITIDKIDNLKEIAGYGLEATIGDKVILVGNTKLLVANNIEYPTEINNIPDTTVICAVNGRYWGYVLIADSLKEDAKNAVTSLRKLGIKNIVMLSGDKQAIVSKLGSELKISEAYGDLLPEGKVEHMEKLKADSNNNIAFVGDGINDAPVLAMSDIGIAMGKLGSDVAIETADVIIQTDQPSRIATAIKIGKATRQIVLQNICFAFGIKLIVLILGAGGLATLWEAVFADVGVALLAILNAVRILKKKFD